MSSDSSSEATGAEATGAEAKGSEATASEPAAGIRLPRIGVGTDVHAVTDGTISTKWNPFYGNMLILTAPDGTQTWYCHLSEYKRRSGTVKAGDIVAYSGDTGNSTGPHLHFEVHPGGDRKSVV